MAGELIFLTGGTGFLGKHLVPLLVSKGYHVRLLVRKTSDVDWISRENVDLVYGDVTDRQSVFDGMRGCKKVIHAAGLFRFWGKPESFQRINEGGTKNVVSAAQHYGINRFIHISTIAVVGNPPPGIAIDENIPCTPQDGYQVSKLAAEEYARALALDGQLPAVVLRPGGFYGPGSYYGINRLFIVEPLRGWRIRVERGRRLTFPVFVPDAAKMIVKTLDKGRVGEVYNISDRSYSHEFINDLVSDLLGISPWRFSVSRYPMIALAGLLEMVSKFTGSEPFYPLNLRHYVFNDWNVSSEKAKKELGFVPTPIEEGLKQTVDWILEMEKLKGKAYG